MPHGMGHHGGGGHHHGGGFRHHGGGFHHHRHHHGGAGGFHHGGYRRGYWGRPWGWGWGYWGWGAPYYAGPGQYRYRRYYGSGSFWGFWVCVTIIFLVFLIAALSVRFDGDGQGGFSSTTYYAPGDTRTFSYSTTFCQGLTLKDESSKYPASLYLLRNKPPLTSHDNFTVDFSGTVISSGSYNYWSFYLYPGSSFSMDYCLEAQSNQLNFYIIRKGSNFDSWEDDPSSRYATYTMTIKNSCAQGKKSLSYDITSAEEYYFALDNPGSLSSTPDVSMHFERTLYDPTAADTVHSCQASSSHSCSVDVPYGSDYVALIAVGTVSDTTYEDNVNIDWDCNARVWVYVLMVAVPSVFLAVCVTTTIIVCCYVARRKKKYQSLGTDATPADGTATAVTVESTDPSAPPPYTPSGYGAVNTNEAPPASHKDPL